MRLLFALAIHLLNKLFHACHFLWPGLLWRYGHLGVDSGFVLEHNVEGILLGFDRLDYALDQRKFLFLVLQYDLATSL